VQSPVSSLLKRIQTAKDLDEGLEFQGKIAHENQLWLQVAAGRKNSIGDVFSEPELQR